MIISTASGPQRPPNPVVRTSDSGSDFQRLSNYHIIWIQKGRGIYQVDFQNYSYTGERILFLKPGQYFSVLTGAFRLTESVVPASLPAQNPRLASASRVLFTHVYEVGAITPSSDLPPVSPWTEKGSLEAWLWDAARHWEKQKPLHPHITPQETNRIFALRHLIEAHYRERRPVREYARELDLSPKWVNHITTSRIDRTIGDLIQSRRILEAKRELFFSGKAIQEIAYALDYADPAYFSRFFSRNTGLSPTAFREKYIEERVNPFLADVWALIEQHFRHTRSVAFYAEQLFLTPKALSAKVKRLTGKPLSQLIKDRVVTEARQLLTTSDMAVQEIAWYLGFEDPFHFSHFFKQATGQAPLSFRKQA